MSSRPQIAIATFAGKAAAKAEDELLRVALGERGVEAPAVVWDAPGVEWAGFDGCLIRSTWDYHDKHDRFLAWTRAVAAATTLWNPAEVIAWNADKAYLRELEQRGIATVPTVWLRRGEPAKLDEVLAAAAWEEAIAKPAVDLGARNLVRVRRGEAAAQAALERILERREALVQPFLPSLVERGELSLVYISGAFSHAVRKLPAPGDFRVQETWGGSFALAEPEPAEAELAARAMAALGEVPLYARVDVVEGLDGRPCVIELELIEPSLFLQAHPAAAGRLAEAVLARLRRD